MSDLLTIASKFLLAAFALPVVGKFALRRDFYAWDIDRAGSRNKKAKKRFCELLSNLQEMLVGEVDLTILKNRNSNLVATMIHNCSDNVFRGLAAQVRPPSLYSGST